MTPFPFRLARFMLFAAAIAVALLAMRLNFTLGCLVLAATIVVAVRSILIDLFNFACTVLAQKAAGPVEVVFLTLAITIAPFFPLLRPGSVLARTEACCP